MERAELKVLMDDGTELECKPGEVSALPSGHVAWVVGSEPAVVVDFQGIDRLREGSRAGSGQRPRVPDDQLTSGGGGRPQRGTAANRSAGAGAGHPGVCGAPG